MVDMLLPAMDMGMPLLGPLMVDMLLPAMDMGMPLLGPLMVDMLLPAMGMPLPEPLIFLICYRIFVMHSYYFIHFK